MHLPVLQKEVIEYLAPQPNQNFIDCTFGEGGHTLALLERNKPYGKILAIDWDFEILARFSFPIPGFKERVILVCDNFTRLEEIVKKLNFQPINGILLDLGISKWHLENSGRGFSFQKNENLDMRYNLETALTAKEILNKWPEKEIERILREYGEERFSKRIAKAIIYQRKIKPIEKTQDLLKIIKEATPSWYHYRRINFATKTFQALRITVNNELKNLKKVLPQALKILEKNGRLVVISFHSLEDRIVKNFFREITKKGFSKILTKKPIRPKRSEISQNPSSRSAKLRAIEKI